jgi:uncharacterized protein (TIGR00299 family) protein
MRILFLDCLSGISGDMSVAALCDLGLDPARLESELAKLGISGECHLHFDRQKRQGIEGIKFTVHPHNLPHPLPHNHPHPHDHPPHAHGRSHCEIRDLIESSALSPFVKRRALATFHRIAVAEGKIHGLPADDVAFHEVGAVDSIIDVVAFCIGVEALGVERVLVSRLFEGTGFIDCAHGRFPLPAPATLEILAGIPLRQIDEPLEFITPTGAAIAAEFGEGFGVMPELAVERIGYGLGTRDTSPRPNVLRAVIGTLAGISGETDVVTTIETNLDDLTPELAAAAAARLLAAGALDVFLAPIQMKKGRPGMLLTVLCAPGRADEFARLILRETTAFGVRLHDSRRLKLRREFTTVETAFGPVTIKLGFLGGDCVRRSPEFESCREAAERAGVPVAAVYGEACAAAVRA